MVASKRKKRAVQIELPWKRMPSGRGGSRPGAGRKPGVGRRRVRHLAREAHSAGHPVHVVLRSRFRPLRSQFVFPTLRSALAKAARVRKDFRITQFSVQGDHVHLIVEAESQVALSRGVQGLAVRVARAVNSLVNRSGALWADRFFSRELSSPRVVRNAVAYVLNNFRKHRVAGNVRIDPYSSGPYFGDFASPTGGGSGAGGVGAPLGEDAPIVAARTWLGRGGWKRAGTISVFDVGRA